MRNISKRRLLLIVPFFVLGCGHTSLKVESIGQPDYPLEARVDRIQGTVVVGVQIGVNGKVLWAAGSGAKPVLVEAAERNARQWLFGPFPPRFKFPLYHEITYAFKLEGHPAFIATEPPDVVTQLPDRIEIDTPPIEPDDRFVPMTPRKN